MSNQSKEEKNRSPLSPNICEGYHGRNRLCPAAVATLSCGENPGSYRDKVLECREKCDFFVEIMDRRL